jgi:hypothetical protein
MATITGLTAAAMQAIVDGTVVSGSVNGSGHLILTLHDGSTIDAGNVKGDTGATGATGAAGADGTTFPLNTIATNNPTSGDVAMNSHKLTGLSAGSANGDSVRYEQVMLKVGGIFTGAVVEAAVNLTFGTTIAIDASLGNTFRVTLTASTGSLGVPSNPQDNQKIIIEVKQDATGSRTFASWNSVYEFTTDAPQPTLTATANKVDELIFIYNSTSGKWRFQGALRGYS